MQLTLKVNDGETVKGALRKEGFLGAIIHVFVPKDGAEPTAKATISAFDFTEHSEWMAGELSIGDKIEIHLLPGHDGDPPTKTQNPYSSIPAYLFSDPNQARQALAAVHVCNEHLQGILRAARDAEPHDEALNIQRAVAKVVQDLGTYLITPTLRRHPELVPEAKDLDLLD